MSGNISNKIVTNGLVLLLDAMNTNSYPTTGTQWLDISGNKNNATLINGVTFTNNSMFFDGVNDQITILDNPTLKTSTGSVSIWFNIMSTQGGSNGVTSIMQKSDASGSLNGWQILATTTLVTIDVKNANLNYQFGSFPITTNKWVNITLTFSAGTTWRAYVNGVFAASQTSLPVTISSTNILMGISNDAFWARFNGFIQLPMMYNRTLTDKEVLQNYNSTKKRFGL